MNIQKTFTFLKNVAESVAPASLREGRAPSGSQVPAGLARPASPAPLLSTHADFDAARVARIREEISAGRYQVNTGKIADGLLATVRDLLAEEPQP
jgi:negative regulator of flagellin synthesis FlgM